MADLEIEGKTVEEAIDKGLAKLKCTRDDVKIKILDEGTSGLFGLMGSKPARVLLSSGNGSSANVDLDGAATKAKKTVSEILKLMKIGFSDIISSKSGEGVSVEMKTSDGSLIIGKGGQTLDALEHVVNLIVNRDEATRTKIDLDTEGYRRRRLETIENLVKKGVAQAKRTGKPFRFDPMPARERRIIHVLLKEDASVETFSEGEGGFRKVVVKPKNS
ncbi:MAG: protein jag [Endomicrobiales bacterium]|nr:protein jag [Endomicrobiales bacterium]